MIDSQTAHAYLRRFELVNAAELAELRATPAEMKLRQLAALMASVQAMGWSEKLADGERESRAIWRMLRERLGHAHD